MKIISLSFSQQLYILLFGKAKLNEEMKACLIFFFIRN